MNLLIFGKILKNIKFIGQISFYLTLFSLLSLNIFAQETKRINIAVLDFGETQTGKLSAEKIFALLSQEKDLNLIDRDLSRAASRGVGYKGSLNLTVEEARNVGEVIGCEFFVTGDAQTLKRSSSTESYYESYATLFVVSARTGKLAMWERLSVKANTQQEAEKKLLNEFAQTAKRYAEKIRTAQKAESEERALSVGKSIPVIEEIPQEGTQEAEGFRPPQPFRRIRPAYTDAAAQAEVEATVDAIVDLNEQGEVLKIDIVRWAGFGLDESVINAVKPSYFRPAMREGKPFPIRVLLRYNFRRPPKEKSQ